jgi:tetratricopeptide (TPR) repeat protein
VRHFEFNDYDDRPYVTENRFIRNGITATSVKWAFTTGYFGTWHPLTWLSHLLDVQLYGMNAGGHHFTSVLIHVANTLLLFALLRRCTGALWRPALVAALFAWHPLHVESVAWVAERKDVLSTFFWMLTLIAYSRYAEISRKGGLGDAGKRLKGRVYYLTATILYALGLMAKPMLVSLPLVLLLMDYWPLGRIQFPATGKRMIELLREKIPFFALSALLCVVTWVVQKKAGAVQDLAKFSFGDRIANALVSYARYLGKIFWPMKLAVPYPYVHNLPLVEVAGAALLLSAVSYLAIRRARSRPVLLVGWLWFVVTLIPVIGLVQVGLEPMADRYSYIPSIGIFLIIAWELPGQLNAWTEGEAAVPAMGFALFACLLLCVRQIGYWQNSFALWSHAIEVTRDNAAAECNLGATLNGQGRAAEAIVHELAALKIRPDYVEAETVLGAALETEGKWDEAIHYLSAAIKRDPYYYGAYYNLGLAYMSTGRLNDAVGQFQTVTKLAPYYAPAYGCLGNIFLQRGDADAAIEQYRQSLTLSPDYAYASNGLAEALAVKKNHQP